MSGKDDYEPLRIEADSSNASAQGVAMILDPIAENMRTLDDSKRYEFELTIKERESQ